MKLTTLKNTIGDTLTFKQIAPYLTGLFYIMPNDSELNDLVMNRNTEQIDQLITEIKAVIDTDSLYAGVDVTDSLAYRDLLAKIAADYRIQLVALPRVNYLDATDHFSIEVLRAIKDGETISNIGQLTQKNGEHWLKPLRSLNQRLLKLTCVKQRKTPAKSLKLVTSH